MAIPYDAVLIVGFGGPTGRDDVMPFLENVTRGRGVPRDRLLAVAEHYYHFDGRSPINDQVPALIDALKTVLASEGPPLPVYWGNRNWHPMLADTVRQMRADGVKHAVALATSAFSSYSGCRQYRENIAAAQTEVGEGAPRIDKIPPYWHHDGFTEAMADHVRAALSAVPAGAELIFTAHSVPMFMATTSRYEEQLREASRRIAERAGHERWSLVWQSRSGPPTQPWLEPDIVDYLRARPDRSPVVIAPVGFLSDHIEVLWDLDHEAREACEELGIVMARAATVGTHAAFIAALRDLILAPLTPCAADCCPAPVRPPSAVPAARG
ncbi:MAG: ferrochelatase [Acidobacteria bacterium]|nr:ferrochelatase [Acidobacteriota bacterium]